MLLLWLALAQAPARVQETCPRAGDAVVAEGWKAYRSNDLDAAKTQFSAAVTRCPNHPGAHTGLGYVAMRKNDIASADQEFIKVLMADGNVVDALVGHGIVAWRRGEFGSARASFERVLALDPGNTDAQDYLKRLRAIFSTPTGREALFYPARAIGERFEIRTPAGWQSFYVKGINIGAAMPGKYPSEFPDSATYGEWFKLIGRMGANTVRIYTMHPPGFYDALRAYNVTHLQPLWLIHGVWAELPPQEIDYDDPQWQSEFFSDMHSVVDMIHGHADIPQRPGHAFGHYTADVSAWTLAYIIGREWESHSVAGFNQLRPRRIGWNGKYLHVDGGTPMDSWMAQATEEIVRYEVDTYAAQRPVAYTNWPTTDPLKHPSETTVMQEYTIRQSLGEKMAPIAPTLAGEDAVTLDPLLVKPTAALPAGYFASYHVYPYYPDFMVTEQAYNQAVSPWGRSNYWGYITALKKYHAGQPLLISEYGVPSSIGIAHLHPQGFDHGGLSERAMAAIDARLTREVAASGAAGGILFAWIDEWFKKTWNTGLFEVPLDRNRLWHNRMDAEEHFGVMAMDAKPPLPGARLSDRLSAWRKQPALYNTSDGVHVRAAQDESYLWLLFEPGQTPAVDVLFGIDTDDPTLGSFAWPGRVAKRLPVGIEFALRVVGNTAHLLANPPSNPVRIVALEAKSQPLAGYPPVLRSPPGFFRGHFGYEVRLPNVPAATIDGVFEPLRVLTSRARWTPSRVEIGAMGYDWGVLPEGEAPDGLWERDSVTGAIEVRIPWQLLNISDPSSRRVLHETRHSVPDGEELATVPFKDIGIVAAARSSTGAWRQWPQYGEAARFTWPTWEQPHWLQRLKPAYETMRQTWQTLKVPELGNANKQ